MKAVPSMGPSVPSFCSLFIIHHFFEVHKKMKNEEQGTENWERKIADLPN
jgi:hypothetical protein